MGQGVGVGHEWIYQQVYADKRSGGGPHRYLRCRKAWRKRYGAADRCGVIPDRTSIDERPAVVDARRRIGDREGDTMIGKGHLGALVTLVERKSRHTIIRAVLRKTAEAVRNAVSEGLAPHINQVHAITYDNGREFSCHASMARDLEAADILRPSLCLVAARTEREHQWPDSPILPETAGADDRAQRRNQACHG